MALAMRSSLWCLARAQSLAVHSRDGSPIGATAVSACKAMLARRRGAGVRWESGKAVGDDAELGLGDYSAAKPRPSEVVSSIVESVQADQKDTTRVLAVLCDNEAGVLSRVTGTLSARGFNIESLTVNATNIPDLSRMTIVMRDVPDHKSVQALKQLSDIVNVWAVVDYTGTNSLQRELVMIKVSYLPNTGNFRADSATTGKAMNYKSLLEAQPHRAAVRDIGALFGAEVVDVGSRHIIFQLTSWSRRIDAFIKMLEPWGVIEVARSGVVAILRSPVSSTEPPSSMAGPQAQAARADAAALPPG